MAAPTMWKCPRCECPGREVGEIRVSGGFWSSFFDVSSRRFNTVSCKRCGYTELYKMDISGTSQIIDFLGSG